MLRRSLAIASIAVLFAGTASAATEKFNATLTAASEVPPTKSTGSGMTTVSLDTTTHEITYDVTFSGFSSPVTAAHIHGPAEAGKNAGVVVPLGNNPTSPIHGTAKLTPEQEQQLTSGLYYVNVHTRNNPNGAIRGQLTQAR
ncbi:MAG: CHRD domain-containing protein [Acetobacteraceae bacterium]|nr:CHRD domain-containing protein [Acetobacteraceae bacterium]